MGDLSARMTAREAAPIAYPRHHITANPQNIRSELFFRSLLSFASTSKAPKLEIYTGLGSSAEWIRIPDSFLDAFAHAPLAHVRTLIFRATSYKTLALLYDMLVFMPARALDVQDYMSGTDDPPAVPDFWSSTSSALRLEHLAYEPIIGLQTLVARVVAPSADTLVEIQLQVLHRLQSAPPFPLMPRVRTLRTNWPAEHALQLVRQFPALSHLAILVQAREHLDALTAVLGPRLRVLDIWHHMPDFGPDDAAQYVSSVTALTTVRRVVIRTSDPCDAETTQPVLDVCRARRVRLRFLSWGEAYADF